MAAPLHPYAASDDSRLIYPNMKESNLVYKITEQVLGNPEKQILKEAKECP